MNYSAEELIHLGIKIGKNVQIHKTVILINPSRITIGSNVRIDAFSILSTSSDGYIEIGSYVHIAAGCYLFGSHGIRFHDFSGLSSRVSIYTASDDYTEGHFTNPTVPIEFKKICSGPVALKRHVIVGASSTILPNITLEEGCAVGAHSLVTRDIPPFQVVAGCPAKDRKTRNKDLLYKMEQEFSQKYPLDKKYSIP